LLYEELRRIARSHARKHRRGHTLQATAIVHEAYLKLADQRCVADLGRVEFLALASEAIRRVLADHAKARNRVKRGGQAHRITLHESTALSPESEVELLDFEHALRELTELDPRQARMIELRIYGGLSDEETAQTLGVSKSTVEKDWRHARAWLRARLADQLA
jgi:RNA polymerase sigma factor (TIGR02999 family)